MKKEIDKYEEPEIDELAEPYPGVEKPLDDFLLAIKDANDDNYHSFGDAIVDRILEWYVERVIEQKRKERIKKTVLSIRPYFQRFNNCYVPSIWETDSKRNRIRERHSGVIKDRIISKYKNKQALSSILNNENKPAEYSIIPEVFSDIDPAFTDEDRQEVFDDNIKSKYEGLPQ